MGFDLFRSNRLILIISWQFFLERHLPSCRRLEGERNLRLTCTCRRAFFRFA